MRHGVKFNHLGRKKGHRKALLSHLGSDLIKNKRIITTLAKAKALRVYVEPLITKSKTNTTHQRRVVFSYLQDKEAVTELFDAISTKVGTRPGGYTRIIKLGTRLGDAAEMALIELVDYNEIYGAETGKPKRKRTRRGGSGGGSHTANKKAEEKKEVKEEATAVDLKESGEPVKEEKKKPTAEAQGEEPQEKKADDHEGKENETDAAKVEVKDEKKPEGESPKKEEDEKES